MYPVTDAPTVRQVIQPTRQKPHRKQRRHKLSTNTSPLSASSVLFASNFTFPRPHDLLRIPTLHKLPTTSITTIIELLPRLAGLRSQQQNVPTNVVIQHIHTHTQPRHPLSFIHWLCIIRVYISLFLFGPNVFLFVFSSSACLPS